MLLHRSLSEQENKLPEFYAQALLTFLYDENPFNELIGREAIFAILAHKLKLTLRHLTLNICCI